MSWIKNLVKEVVEENILDTGDAHFFLFRMTGGKPSDLGQGNLKDIASKLKVKGQPVRIKRIAPSLGYRSGYNALKYLLVGPDNKPVAFLVAASSPEAVDAVRNNELSPADLTRQMTEVEQYPGSSPDKWKRISGIRQNRALRAPEYSEGQKIKKLADEYFQLWGGHPQSKNDFSAGFLLGYRSGKSGEE